MKPLTFEILRLLSDGEFHSGQVLARGLGLSRASVWNALQGLEDTGLEVYKIRGRGYRLSAPIRWLDIDAIQKRLVGAGGFFDVQILNSVSSTNTFLMREAELGAAHGSVVVTEQQTDGRGRYGRRWQSGLGDALTFSLLWRFAQGASALSGLSLAVSVALVRVLKSFGIDDAAVKWPNDIVWRYRKLAGILIELHGDVLGPSAAVIGIGLNTQLTQNIKSSLEQAAVDLHEIGVDVDRNEFLAQLLVELKAVLEMFSQQGFISMRDEWERFHAYQGKEVRVCLPDGNSHRALAQGVDENGALVVRVGTEIKRYHSAEVSLNPLRPQVAVRT